MIGPEVGWHRSASRPSHEGFDVPATHRRVWDFTRDGIRRTLESSLVRLGLDRVIGTADKLAGSVLGDRRIATRGAEWFTFAADGRITEIRSYYQQREQTTELDGFPYAERGYSL